MPSVQPFPPLIIPVVYISPSLSDHHHHTLTDCKILSMPLGPSVVFTRSAMAMAPMKALRRAFSPCGERGAGWRGEGGSDAV